MGHTFVSNTDSETLIHGYEEWGESLVERLRGMYAFAIWDTRKKKLFVARDIFGIKPLYYAQMNGTLMFASEIKAFMEHPKFDKVFNEDALGNYLSFRACSLQMRPFSKGCSVCSRDIILLMRMVN